MAERIVTDDGDLLDGLIGEDVDVWCLNFIYTGTLEALDADTLHLVDASVVYETGPLNAKGYTDAQPLPNSLYLNRRTVESITLKVK